MKGMKSNALVERMTPETIKPLDAESACAKLDHAFANKVPMVRSSDVLDAIEADPDGQIIRVAASRIEATKEAIEKFKAARSEMVKAADAMAKSIDEVSIKAKTAASRGKDAANQLVESVHRISKMAGDDLEKHIQRLERLNAALESLATFEKSGLLERIGKAINAR